ncbi:hypothetical protein HALLA_18955 [Halostagnicola larsenii XH-48]|uniref:Transporter n=1 Tax=Halostagnicola larsenii XH-48 TaxID=797299 RepID=W0JPA5_9EURY|nr:hypothetical protein [Halostagnicola larsenii]AHG00556.1 hypothetical protein HALLA_18955 [Halostagnicola larsenii XH-48]
MLERDSLIETGAAILSVLLMVSTMVYIGTTYSGSNGELSADGGQMLVAAIVGFVIFLTGVGVVLAYTLNDPEDGLENDVDTQGSA